MRLPPSRRGCDQLRNDFGPMQFIAAKIPAEELNEDVDALKAELEKTIKYAIAGYDDDSMPIVIGRMLKEQNLKLACAESCTGGFLSHLITAVPGSSEYFTGGVIAYANEVKNKTLNVPNKILKKNGAVSEECVKAMVRGVIKKMDVDVAIAVSGIAGPGGGTPDKPVGTVWVAVGDIQNIITYKINIDDVKLSKKFKCKKGKVY